MSFCAQSSAAWQASDSKERRMSVGPFDNSFLKVHGRPRLESIEFLHKKPCFAIATCISTSVKIEKHGRQAKRFALKALPMEAVSAAAAIVLVGSSAGALIWLNRDKAGDGVSQKVECNACNGSGLCPSCNGEGFQLKSLSAEAAARARANARDAATRNTAALAKKWNYCADCSGSRNCQACDGRGTLKIGAKSE